MQGFIDVEIELDLAIFSSFCLLVFSFAFPSPFASSETSSLTGGNFRQAFPRRGGNGVIQPQALFSCSYEKEESWGKECCMCFNFVYIYSQMEEERKSKVNVENYNYTHRLGIFKPPSQNG